MEHGAFQTGDEIAGWEPADPGMVEGNVGQAKTEEPLDAAGASHESSNYLQILVQVRLDRVEEPELQTKPLRNLVRQLGATGWYHRLFAL